MRYELVVWKDAWSDHEWTETNEIKCEPFVVTSCGMVVKENEHGIILALDQVSSGEVNSYGFIPTGMIVSRTQLTSASSVAEGAES